MSDAGAGASRADVMLELDHVTKRFGDTVALEDVSFRLRRGTVHALLGENGAGKTTLMRIAFGLVRADAGTVRSAYGVPIVSPAVAIASGIGMVHQHFTNVGAMTVAENVALGGRGVYDARAAAERVRSIASRTGLALEPTALAEVLPVGAQQRLEIVKALARDARALILDEPTAVLAPAEASELLRWLRRYADEGNAVVLITHKLRDALGVADEVTVLRRGRCVLSTNAAEVSEISLAAALLGEEQGADGDAAARVTVGEVVARVTDLDVLDERGALAVRNATLELRAGEIVGIAAVEGSGQRELLRAFARRLNPVRGNVSLPAAIGFVPEDRHRDGLVLDFTTTENVALRDAGARRGGMPWRALSARTASLVATFDVRGASERQPVRSLSGGNQQKLVLARELEGAPRLLVVENPTRGLDIRATRAVHDRLRAAAAGGAAVLAHSSDLDEVLSLATRLVVIHAGTLREVELDRDVVGRAMLGVA